MYSKIFKDDRKNNYNESYQLNSITKFIKNLSNKILSKQPKKYKFTGNRAMAKHVRGNSYILQPPSYYRLSIIKSRIVKNKPWYDSAQKVLAVSEHIKYLIRNEVGLDGNQAKFFDSESDNLDGKKFATSIAQDRHYFRFIVSPEDGAQVDLINHARDLVKKMEQDLGLKLNWLGVVHKNTDNPHLHLVIKGTENNGKDLIIKPDYITHGIRFRSSDLLTLELGPRSELSIIKARKRALLQDRAIAIDYKIAKLAREHNGKFTPLAFQAEVKAASIRIKHLQKLNLVTQPNNWPKNFYQIDPRLIEKLKDLEAHYDIYKKIARCGLKEARQYIQNSSMIGRVINKGLQDELAGDYYVVIDGVDGHKWSVDLSKYKNVEQLKVGQLVILECNKLSKETMVNEHHSKLHVEPIESLQSMITAPGLTILDRCVVNKDLQAILSNNGVGAELKDALEQRKQVLVDRGLAKFIGQEIIANKNLFNELKKVEINNLKNDLRNQGYYVHNDVPKNFVGQLKTMVKLSGIDYALVEGIQKNLAIVAISNKEFMQLQGKKVSINYREFSNGLAKFIIKPVGQGLSI